MSERLREHPRFAEVKALHEAGESRATIIATKLGLPGDVARELLAQVTGQFAYYTTKPGSATERQENTHTEQVMTTGSRGAR